MMSAIELVEVRGRERKGQFKISVIDKDYYQLAELYIDLGTEMTTPIRGMVSTD